MFEENQDDIIFLIRSYNTHDIIIKIYCDSDSRYIKCDKSWNIHQPLWKVGDKLSLLDVDIYVDMFLDEPRDPEPRFYVEETTEFEIDYKNYNL